MALRLPLPTEAGSAEEPPSIRHKSTDREVRALIDALGASEARREAAVARLTIIGSRAVARLIAAFEASSDRRVQIAILRVLEATGDDRVLPIARRALSCGGDLAVEAVTVLQEILGRGSLSLQAEALEALVATAGNPQAERRVKLAAAQVVNAVAKMIGPVSTGPFDGSLTATEAVWADAAEGHLPDDPATLRSAAAEQATRAPLPVVHHIIEFVRLREQTAASARDSMATTVQSDWRAVRGALHQALAMRGSRIALYDLRETIAGSREPLPSSFIAAIQTVGDDSCLEPLATAFALSAPDEAAWRHQLATAFHMVAKRERVTKKRSSMRRALTRAPELG